MAILESSTITGIYVAAAIIGIIASAIAIYVFFWQNQFKRARLNLTFDLREPPNDVPRKFRKQPVTMFVIAPTRETRKPLLGFVFFVLNNPGSESIKNIRVSFEYSDKFLVNNKLFAAVANFKPVMVQELTNSKTATVVKSALSQEDIELILRERQVQVFQDRAQVSMDISILRPGEGVILYDIVLLPGSGADDITKLGFGAGGFSHIVALLRKKKRTA